MVQLVLIRHGESEANFANTYTGWSDVPLTAKGEQQAQAAGEAVAQAGIAFAHVHTSVLKRAIKTAYIVQSAMGQDDVAITKSWRLNERHYGALRGLNKDVTREAFGADQVAQWRRSFTQTPPLLQRPSRSRRYHRFPASIIPRGESLATATARLLPYWTDQIAPGLLAGQNQLVVAHGSTLRAMVKFLEAIPDAEIDRVEIGNAQPLCYTLDEQLNVTDKAWLSKE